MKTNSPADRDKDPNALTELIATALREKWCTRLGCTTCGAVPFRQALRAIPKENVLSGLRLLSAATLKDHDELFRLIVSEVSLLPTAADLVPALAGTPAGVELQEILAHHRQQQERRRAYLASQTPEAIAEHRAQRVADYLAYTEPHRDRKASTEAAIRAAREKLSSIPPEALLSEVAEKDFGISHRALGGLAYGRLNAFYRGTPISFRELTILTRLAEAHGGHWKKLLRDLS